MLKMPFCPHCPQPTLRTRKVRSGKECYECVACGRKWDEDSEPVPSMMSDITQIPQQYQPSM